MINNLMMRNKINSLIKMTGQMVLVSKTRIKNPLITMTTSKKMRDGQHLDLPKLKKQIKNLKYHNSNKTMALIQMILMLKLRIKIRKKHGEILISLRQSKFKKLATRAKMRPGVILISQRPSQFKN